jgi:hypothetical protein
MMRVVASVLAVAVLLCAPYSALAGETGARVGDTVEEGTKTGGRAVRDGLKTFGRATRDFFKGGPAAAKRTWKANARHTKENARAGGRATRDAAQGPAAEPEVVTPPDAQ